MHLLPGDIRAEYRHGIEDMIRYFQRVLRGREDKKRKKRKEKERTEQESG